MNIVLLFLFLVINVQMVAQNLVDSLFYNLNLRLDFTEFVQINKEKIKDSISRTEHLNIKVSKVELIFNEPQYLNRKIEKNIFYVENIASDNKNIIDVSLYIYPTSKYKNEIHNEIIYILGKIDKNMRIYSNDEDNYIEYTSNSGNDTIIKYFLWKKKKYILIKMAYLIN